MKIEELQKTMLFACLNADEILQALEALTWYEKDVLRGELVLHAGQTTDAVGLLLNGAVTIENNDLWGNRTVLSMVEAGQFFAESYACLPEEVMLVDVRAAENSQILFIKIGRLFDLAVGSCPWAAKMSRNLLRISAHKNLALSGRSFHTAHKTARRRIMSYLNAVSLQQHSRSFSIPFDRQQLADYLNLERTVLSKELGKMQKEGLLTCRKNQFELLENEFETI